MGDTLENQPRLEATTMRRADLDEWSNHRQANDIQQNMLDDEQFVHHEDEERRNNPISAQQHQERQAVDRQNGRKLDELSTQNAELQHWEGSADEEARRRQFEEEQRYQEELRREEEQRRRFEEERRHEEEVRHEDEQRRRFEEEQRHQENLKIDEERRRYFEEQEANGREVQRQNEEHNRDSNLGHEQRTEEMNQLHEERRVVEGNEPDECPDDPNKTRPGMCGCGVPEDTNDDDKDGAINCLDRCPRNPERVDGECDCLYNKANPGQCGCKFWDIDTDKDGTADCLDTCPLDPEKTSPGRCGCGSPDTDVDHDGTPDCLDYCPHDPLKTVPLTCGCGVPETDTDKDGTPDCIDQCPKNPLKTFPLSCGCEVAEGDCWTTQKLEYYVGGLSFIIVCLLAFLLRTRRKHQNFVEQSRQGFQDSNRPVYLSAFHAQSNSPMGNSPTRLQQTEPYTPTRAFSSTPPALVRRNTSGTSGSQKFPESRGQNFQFPDGSSFAEDSVC